MIHSEDHGHKIFSFKYGSLTLPLHKILSGVADLTQHDAPEDGRAVTEGLEDLAQVDSWPAGRSYRKCLA
jgi:hypothetical protein